MTNEVLIRRLGTLIDISPDGQSPLDPRIIQLLAPKLRYEHKTLLRGHNRYSPDGASHGMQVESRNMYQIEEGRLVTGFGFITTIGETLHRHGITPRYIDLSPPKDPAIYTPDWDNVRRYVNFRAKQEECLYYITQNQCGIINATMGFGKSFLFEALAHLYPRAKFDITTKSVSVAQTIVNRLTRTIPNVGFVCGNSKVGGDRVNVYTIGSAHYARGDSDFLLADEVHELMTDDASASLAKYWRYTRNFGFSGTIGARTDGADAQLELFFGREIFKLTYPEAVALGLVVPIHVRWLPIRLGHNPAKDKSGVPKLRWGIWRNEDRNRIIAEDVRRNYPDYNTQILILTATVDHAIMLWQQLPEFALCYGESMSSDDIERYKRNNYLPPNFVEMTAGRRDMMRQQFEAGTLKRVIATDVWATGVSFDQLQVLYRTDARESEIKAGQGPARVSRLSPETNKEIGEVIDCYDAFDDGFKRKSEARKRHYTKLGWSQDWPSGRRQIGGT